MVEIKSALAENKKNILGTKRVKLCTVCYIHFTISFIWYEHDQHHHYIYYS